MFMTEPPTQTMTQMKRFGNAPTYGQVVAGHLQTPVK